MTIPGIPAEHLVRFHENYGGGEGAIGYMHLPSGVVVYRQCPPDVPVSRIDQELIAELREKLRERGIPHGEDLSGEPASPGTTHDPTAPR